MPALVAAVLALSAVTGDLALAERGKPVSCSVVVPRQATPVQRYAAEELRDFTTRITGVHLPIRTPDDPLSPVTVVLEDGGKDNPPEDGFRLRVSDGCVRIIAAADRGGPLYGVYELLERFGGCRWYSSWCAKIQPVERFAVPSGLDETHVPAFSMRQTWWFDALRHHDFAARLRMNTHQWSRMEDKYGGERFRFGGGLGSCHTFEELVPIEKYGKEHPEYFAFRDGHRRNVPTGTIQYYAQLCLTNPDVLKLVVEGVRERIRKDPGARFYGVSQNDNWHYCQCEKCAAIDAEEDSHAGTVVRFVNAVAEEIEKEFPDVTIETLAYMYSRRPPKKTRLRHNVIPCLCSIECDFAWPIPSSPYKENVAFREDIRGWAKQTDELYVWDYTTDFSNYPMPFANVLSLQDNIRFFRDNGVKFLFEQGCYQGGHADFAELKAWLLAKWMWNPELPVEGLLDDFFNGYYGAAAPIVRKYFDELHRLQRDYSSDPSHPLKIFDDVDSPAIPDDFLTEAAELWKRAAEMVKGDEVRSYNVRMGAFSVDYARLERMRKRLDPLLTFDRNWSQSKVAVLRRTLAKTLLDRMKEAKDIRMCELDDRNDGIVGAWRKILEHETRPVESNRAELEESVLILNEPVSKWGEFVKDPQAGDGKALKLFNNHYEWCAEFHMSRIVFVPGQRYRLRIRVRVEPKAGAVGMAFWAGVYDPVGKKGCGGISCEPKVTEIKSGYQWYEVANWVPKRTDYLWVGPGYYHKDKGESTSVEGVWIDRIEISKVMPAQSHQL